jgi:predicted transposase/invertase (TIGR01784 family)
VRQHRDAGYELEEAIRLAVEECIEKNILSDFLRTHSSEVINMLTLEFKLEDALQVWKKEGFDEGIEKGREEGFKEGEEKNKVKVACSMLADGFPVETVRKYTGLGERDILSLK